MKKKIGLFFGLLLGFCAIGSIGVGFSCANYHENAIIAKAESEEEPPAEVFESQVVLSTFQHGEIEVDKLEGHVGDIVTVTAKSDLFYLVDYVSVNGTNLVESEDVRGQFTFSLVEGENKIEAKFIVDEKLLGTFTEMYEQASNKDWTSLFSLKNVITIISFFLSSGLLIAMVRYFIKDKKLADRVENRVEKVMTKAIPEATKEAVVAQVEETLTPVFAKISGYQEEIVRVLASLVKCIALMQEGTPEAKNAVLNELTNLNVGDNKVIEEAKAIIEKFAQEKLANLNDLRDKLDEITRKNQNVVNQVEKIVEDKVDEPKQIVTENKQATE